MRPLLALIVVLVALVACGGVRAQELPAYQDAYVNDFADILSNEEEQQIRGRLINLFDQTGVEAVVVTMTTMRRYGHTGPIEPFATALFNKWGVGNATANTGVMLLVAKDDHQMRIELGKGYDSAMAKKAQVIIDERILPKFRQGQFGPGISAGVADLVNILLARSGKAAPAGLFEPIKRGFETMSTGFMAISAIIGLGILALGTRLFQFWRRNRPHYCPADGHRMVLMTEDADNHELQQGQTTEERLGSVDYDVWDCPHCQLVTVEAYRRWFSSYEACRSCGFHTLQGTTTVLESATTSHSGRKCIDYCCLNCAATYSVIKTIPQVSESGSSRSSFGGGSSSGGGASGRW